MKIVKKVFTVSALMVVLIVGLVLLNAKSTSQNVLGVTDTPPTDTALPDFNIGGDGSGSTSGSTGDRTSNFITPKEIENLTFDVTNWPYDKFADWKSNRDSFGNYPAWYRILIYDLNNSKLVYDKWKNTSICRYTDMCRLYVPLTNGTYRTYVQPYYYNYNTGKWQAGFWYWTSPQVVAVDRTTQEFVVNQRNTTRADVEIFNSGPRTFTSTWYDMYEYHENVGTYKRTVLGPRDSICNGTPLDNSPPSEGYGSYAGCKYITDNMPYGQMTFWIRGWSPAGHDSHWQQKKVEILPNPVVLDGFVTSSDSSKKLTVSWKQPSLSNRNLVEAEWYRVVIENISNPNEPWTGPEMYFVDKWISSNSAGCSSDNLCTYTFDGVNGSSASKFIKVWILPWYQEQPNYIKWYNSGNVQVL